MGPLVLIVPLALAAIGLAAAASNKKKPGEAGTPATPGTAGTPATPTYATGYIQAQAQVPVPLDIQTMLQQAVNSGNPDTMRSVATAIRLTYPAQAQFLDETATTLQGALAPLGASNLAQAQQMQQTQTALQAAQTSAGQALAQGATPVQAVQAAQQAATTVAQASAPPPPLAPPAAAQVTAALALPQQALQAAQAAGSAALAAGATPTQAVLAAQNAAVMTTTPGVNQAVTAAVNAAQQLPGLAPAPAAPAPRPEPAVAPMPSVAPAAPSNQGGKQLAADMAKALLKAKKGTSSEPRALVQAFQTQERLEQNDGSYGFETAMALADRYGIVPPKPLYWGKKGGPPNLPAQQKQAYSAHLLVLRSNDPQRADEWTAASKV